MGEDFSFKEIDLEGEETLDTIASATRFNRWMYDTIRPHCTGRILEIGSGIGNISRFFIDSGADIVLSDVRDQYCNRLREKFPTNDVQLIDLVTDGFELKYKGQLESYDTIFALNVIEHIEDDDLAIVNIKKLLRPNGVCVILVPAFDFLYNSFDKDLYHFRRYDRSRLLRLMQPHFKICSSRYFNPVGILGWYVNGNILKKKLIPSDQMALFDRLVPIFKGVDFFTRQVMGLSVIAVGEK